MELDKSINDNNEKVNDKNQELIVPNNSQNNSIVRSNLYTTDLQNLGEYKNFREIDIKKQTNINRKMVIYNLPDVNEDEIKQYFISLLNKIIKNDKFFSAISSFERQDGGEFYILKLARSDYCSLLKNFDGIEWLNYKIRIAYLKEFVSDYNLTNGKILIKKKVNESLLFKSLAQNTDDDNENQRMYMSGFGKDEQESEIRKLLESYGKLKYFTFFGNYHSTSNGYCFFEYENNQNRIKAFKYLNGFIFHDKKLKVNKANISKGKEILNIINNTPTPDIKNNKTTIGGYSFKMANQILQNAKEGKEDLNIQLKAEEDEKGFIDNHEVNISNLCIPEEAKEPSRVLMFINCINPEDVIDDADYKEIIDDFRSKCNEYGTVLNIEIPRPDKVTQTCGKEIGRIFVKFSDIKSAKIARLHMSGLRYGQRLIIASFYKEMQFDIRNFSL